MSNIQQYADYTNSSDLFLDTAIDDKGALSSLAEEMNYRLALTLNQLVSTSADALNGTDNTVNQQLAVGTYLTASNLRTIAQQLESVNVRPFEDNTYAGVINPLVVHDLYNDASFNGLTDIMKRQGDTAKKLGLDIYTTTGNIAYAKHLYEEQGTQPWNSSSKCWSGVAVK